MCTGLAASLAHTLDDSLRRIFLGRAQSIEPDVDTLRKNVQCPADASR